MPIARLAASYGPAALVLAVPLLLPVARLVELPLLVMLAVGVADLRRQGRALLARPAFVLFLTLFGCYWIPGALSAIDAVEPAKAWSWAAAQLRFVPVGAFVVARLDRRQQRLVLLGAAAIVMFWTLDVLVQAALGRNLLGMATSPDRLNGVFGATNIKLGLVLAAYGALAIEGARRCGPRWGIGAYLLLLAAVVLIGTRAAWIMFAVVTAAFLYHHARGRPVRVVTGALLVAVAAALLLVGGYHGSRELRGRLDVLEESLALRIPIWEAAASMAADHPLDGVGVRGFRYAYRDYAQPDDPWLADGGSATHAHQLLLEVASETGLIGLLGLALALTVALRAWGRASDRTRARARPWAIALVAVLFPINTHLAFYSTFWSIVFWWLVLLFCVHLEGGDAPPELP